METTVDQGKEVESGHSADEYREAVKKLINAEVRSLIDEELRRAAQELLEEQRMAIKQMVEEHRSVIREVVEEEKKEIRGRVEELKKSILKLGLG